MPQVELAVVFLWTWSKRGISRSGVGAWIYWDKSATEVILAPLKLGNLHWHLARHWLQEGPHGGFSAWIWGVDMKCTAEVVWHLSIHPIQFSLDFPNIITRRRINGYSVNYWLLVADSSSSEPCLWQSLIFRLVWIRVAMKRY